MTILCLGHILLDPCICLKSLYSSNCPSEAGLTSMTDVEEMALSWPHIQDLTLQGGYYLMSEIACVTLSGLIPFMQHCLDLERLSIIFNSCSVPPPMSNPQRFCSDAMKILHVEALPVEKPEWVESRILYWYYIVFQCPVQSGFSTPKQGNWDHNQSKQIPKLEGPQLNWLGPVLISSVVLQKLVLTRFTTIFQL